MFSLSFLNEVHGTSCQQKYEGQPDKFGGWNEKKMKDKMHSIENQVKPWSVLYNTILLADVMDIT